MFSSFRNNSIKINYILNIIRLASAALVFVIISAYVNRILGVENIGKVEYANTIINYFLIISALGIPMYGIRAIARCQKDENQIAKITAELFIILACTTIVAYLVLFGFYFSGFFKGYDSTVLTLSAMILLTNFGFEWYFLGKEEHFYITVRYLIVRIISVFLVFFFVKDSADFNIYAICLVILNTGGGLFNLFVVAKEQYKNFKFKYQDLEIKKHLKPAFTLFIATVSINIYLQLDYFLLGYYTTDENVGYYSVANRLLRYAINFITVIGVVALPRLSALYLEDKEKYFKLQEKTITYLLIISIPASIYFFWFSDLIINLMAGPEFSSSAYTLKILSPLCFVVSLAYILGFLVLYPQTKEHIYTTAVIFTAVFSIIVNILTIQTYKENGAAIVAVLSEILAILIMLFFIKLKKIEWRFDVKNSTKVFFASAILFFLFAVGFNFLSETLTRVVLGIVLFFVYLLILLLLKEKEIYNAITLLKRKR